MGFVLKQTHGNSGSLDFQDVSNYGIPAIFKASIHHVSSYQDQLNGAFVFGAVTMVMNVPQKRPGSKNMHRSAAKRLLSPKRAGKQKPARTLV